MSLADSFYIENFSYIIGIEESVFVVSHYTKIWLKFVAPKLPDPFSWEELWKFNAAKNPNAGAFQGKSKSELAIGTTLIPTANSAWEDEMEWLLSIRWRNEGAAMKRKTITMGKALASMASALLAFSLGGCATSQMQAARGNTQAMFLTETAHASASELEVSRLAEQRANDPRVKQYAAMVIQDHVVGDQQLQQLARSRNMDVPLRADEAHVKNTTTLRQLSGRQFDQEYMSLMVADHAKLLSQFQDRAARTQDPQIRAWVESQIPVLQRHLDRAREINKSLGGASTLGSSV